ncbi:hypothetical protein HFN86_16010 [Rhizobium laguerreae]|nr:hypothetical protein [Rhizobium laguerreae]
MRATIAARQLDRPAPGILLAVAVDRRRVAEVRPRVIALLRWRRPPDLPVIAKVTTFVHQLREVLHQAMQPVHPEIVAVAIERDEDGFHIALIHGTFGGRANLLSGDSAHKETPDC